MYAQKDIVILDDAFSGLDATTENHVFHGLLGESGLFRRLRSTVVLSSSSRKLRIQPDLLTFLLSLLVFKATTLTPRPAKRLPYADHIVALDAEGRICEQGTFDELSNTGGYVSSFTLPAADWLYKPGGEVVPSKGTLINATRKTQSVPENEEEFEAAANRRTGDTSIYFYYASSVGWPITILFVICMSAFIFCISFPSKCLFL